MKFGVLRSIGHNIADSVASGVGLMIGVYVLDVFDIAQRSPDGFVEVDFLSGQVKCSEATEDLVKMMALYVAELPGFCRKHGIEPMAFKTLEARFGVDRVYGRHFRVTVEDHEGRRAVDEYIGSPGRRFRSR